MGRREFDGTPYVALRLDGAVNLTTMHILALLILCKPNVNRIGYVMRIQGSYVSNINILLKVVGVEGVQVVVSIAFLHAY